MSKKITMMGERFGRLVVIDRASNLANGNRRWHCRCDCGSETVSVQGSLRNGTTQSCGCRKVEMLVARNGLEHHGMSKTPTHVSWTSMRERCSNPNYNRYADWGGRGIRVCEKWDASFKAFVEDMGLRPSLAHSLDRIDNDRGYEPGNCRWATRSEQQRNRRPATSLSLRPAL